MVRPYDAGRDRAALWALKRAFETGLGDTGGSEKTAAYAEKLTATYRERYLDWVADCVAENPRCVQVADPPAGTPGDGERGGAGADPGGGARSETPGGRGSGGGDPALAGYVFVLPSSLAMVWDAAVLNEIYVGPDARGTGLADDLMEAALALARDQDLPLDRVVLDVDRANERARAFYERHGFTHWGEMVAREL